MIRYRHHQYSRETDVAVPGYIDTRFVHTQYFVRDLLLFGLFVLHRKVLFCEEVPVWALSESAFFGCCHWRSSCPSEIWSLCTGKEMSAPHQN